MHLYFLQSFIDHTAGDTSSALTISTSCLSWASRTNVTDCLEFAEVHAPPVHSAFFVEHPNPRAQRAVGHRHPRPHVDCKPRLVRPFFVLRLVRPVLLGGGYQQDGCVFVGRPLGLLPRITSPDHIRISEGGKGHFGVPGTASPPVSLSRMIRIDFGTMSMPSFSY